jgi:hypothetical protein
MDDTLIEDLQDLDPTDKLTTDADRVHGLAKQRGLAVYPGFPALDDEDSAVRAVGLSAEDFLTIASDVGCRLVYVDAQHFYADEANISEYTGKQQAALRKLTKRFDNQLMSISLYFRHNGVWHRWNEESAAMDLLWELTETSPAGTGRNTDTAPRVSASESLTHAWIHAEDIGEDKLNELVQIFVADPEYRDGGQQVRHNAVRHHPALKEYVDAGGDVCWRVGELATKTLEAMKKDAYDRLRTQRVELANELCSTPGWADARTVEMKKVITDAPRARRGSHQTRPRRWARLPGLRCCQRRSRPCVDLNLSEPAGYLPAELFHCSAARRLI